MKLVTICVLAVATPALADPKNTVQNVMPGILSTADGGSIDLRGDYTHVDLDGDPTLFGFTASGQYVTPGGFGVYGSVPFVYAAQDNLLGQRNSESGIGNLELGGLFVKRNSPELDIYGQGGIALDTADNDVAIAAPLALFVPQPYNSLPSALNSDWLRLHGGIRTKGALQVGVSGGLDFPLDGDLRDSINSVFVLSGALGIQQPGFGLSGGLTYVLVSGDGSANASNDDTLGLNVILDFDIGPKAKLFGAFGLNLDDANDNLGFSLGFGARLAI